MGEINRQICCQNWHEFHGNEKLGPLCFASQDSHNNHTMLQTSQEQEKTRFLKFICSDFWTDLNGCYQGLLFAHQLTKRKCSLSWQPFNSDLLCYPCYPLLPLLPHVTPCYPCYRLLPLVPLVIPCYSCYPLLLLFTSCYPLLPFVTPCYPLLPHVTPCYLLLPLLPHVTPCYPC